MQQGYLEMRTGWDSVVQGVLGFALLLGRASTPTIQACAIGASAQVLLGNRIGERKKKEEEIINYRLIIRGKAELSKNHH